MKINIFPHQKQVGYALITVLVFASIAILILAATVRRSATTAMLNERENQFNRTYFAAEAAVEKVVGHMLSDFKQGQSAYIAMNVTNTYQSTYPGSEDGYWSSYEFSDGQGQVNKTYVKLVVTGRTNWISDQADGLSRWRTIYRVLSNARDKTASYKITNASQIDIAVDSIPVFQFAIFYNTNQLEFTWAAPFVINGRVHANGPIYTGVSSSSSLTFNSLISTTGTITKKALGGYQVSNMTGPETYNAGQKTNNIPLTLPIGTNSTWEMINIPPPGEDVSSTLGTNRYYNKAGMILLVSNSSVTMILKDSAGDQYPTNVTYNFTNTTAGMAGIVTNLPFLTLTNTFYDARESKTVRATQIDMGALKSWATTNGAVLAKRPSNNPLSVLYVADRRTVTASQLDAVRLSDAATLPSFGASGSGLGFTVATINPVYVWGNYNEPNSTYLGTTNTTQTVPASIASDALTILSPNWADANSASSLSSRTPTATTVNAALLTGTVFTTGTDSSTFSGGVHNLPRLLEDWSTSIQLTLNTSIVNLFASVYATNQFQLPGNYYNAPSRKFSFDINFTDPAKQPPGAPMIGGIKRLQWATPPPDNVAYEMP